MINITPIPAFQDNYIWLIAVDDQAWVIDPGDAQPVLEFLATHKLTLAGIIATHHHFDHIGGINMLLSQNRIPVYGNPAKISQVSVPVQEGDTLNLNGFKLRVIDVPGNTLDHIAYFGDIPGYGPCLFCGDTLFSAGCGRLFEGTPEIMLSSLGKLAVLPANTKIFCAHEYTLANLAFAKAVMPESADVQTRIDRCQQLRANRQPTLPAILSEELTYNPFLMTSNDQVITAATNQLGHAPDRETDVFAAIRQWKDGF
jgi:hydroxyacylglutathione hydrolase